MVYSPTVIAPTQFLTSHPTNLTLTEVCVDTSVPSTKHTVNQREKTLLKETASVSVQDVNKARYSTQTLVNAPALPENAQRPLLTETQTIVSVNVLAMITSVLRPSDLREKTALAVALLNLMAVLIKDHSLILGDALVARTSASRSTITETPMK